MNLDASVLLHGETKADATANLQSQWEEQQREVVATEAGQYGGVPGRCYISKGRGHPIDAGWYLLDFPGGFRIVELDVRLGQWDPFHQEAKKVLATLSAV
jgi:hypothetical protein